MRRRYSYNFLLLFSTILLATSSGWAAGRSRRHHHPVQINLRLHTPFRFIAYGDTRFTDPADTKAANPEVRRQLVSAIAEAHPSFIAFTGDITHNGNIPGDWKVYDSETAVWRERGIPVFPALGNHDLHAGPDHDLHVALKNYFARYPRLRHSRFYSVRAANSLMLVLDSSLDELSGPQGRWLRGQLAHVAARTDFVFVMLHHPPYTSSSDSKELGGGHSERPQEEALAAFLESRQKALKAQIVVFAGHVHNYERHEHGGVTYFVTGGGGAHAYPITRAAADPFQSKEINYHYMLIEVGRGKITTTMNRLELENGVAKWTKPDSVTIPSIAGQREAPATAAGSREP